MTNSHRKNLHISFANYTHLFLFSQPLFIISFYFTFRRNISHFFYSFLPNHYSVFLFFIIFFLFLFTFLCHSFVLPIRHFFRVVLAFSSFFFLFSLFFLFVFPLLVVVLPCSFSEIVCLFLIFFRLCYSFLFYLSLSFTIFLAFPSTSCILSF